MRDPTAQQRDAARSADNVALSASEREVLTLLVDGLSLRTVSRRLAISDAQASVHRRELLRKFMVTTTAELISRAISTAAVAGNNGVSRENVRLLHQSRWLPEITLSRSAPLGKTWRHVNNCRSLRDVADVVREFGDNPGDYPDDPDALLKQGTGTLGAKQALLAALAAECGRYDVQLVVACHELELPPPPAPGERRLTLPLAACYLRCRAREVQIAREGSGSILYGKAVSVVRVEARTLARERIRLYQSFAADWCRALDVAPAEFARLRAQQLLNAERIPMIEDLLGYCLAPDYVPGAR